MIIHKYNKPLAMGQLKHRYKRFLADVEFGCESTSSNTANNITVVHCPNTGSMLGLLPHPNEPRLCACVDNISDKNNSKRKYQYTLEMIQDEKGHGKTWVGIHSAFANKLVKEAITKGFISEIPLNFSELNSEVKVGSDSRIDFEIVWNQNTSTPDQTTMIEIGQTDDTANQVITKKRKAINGKSNKSSTKQQSNTQSNGTTISRKMFVEVKSVTLAEHVLSTGNSNSADVNQNLHAVFPDCVSERAQKHTKCLIDLITNKNNIKNNTQKVKNNKDNQAVTQISETIGNEKILETCVVEAAILFLIQRDDCVAFSASNYDVEYRKLLSQAYKAGVQILPYHCRLDPASGVITLLGKLPFIDTYKP